MINQELGYLRNFILQNNLYFDEGVANVWLDSTSGWLLHGEEFEKRRIGYDDTLGNYFYLRYDPEFKYAESRFPISDTSRTFDESTTCYLVAFIKDKNPQELGNALINTLLNYGNQRIRPVRSIYNRETAVAKEFKTIPKEDRMQILKNLLEYQVILIEFELIYKYQPKPLCCNNQTCSNCGKH